MKTIEIISGAQKAQFTTKSVTLDGREYFYINMSDVRNDKLNRVYTFVYDSEVKAVPYEEKDAKTLSVIFGQVRAMEEKRRAHDRAAAHHEEHTAPGTAAAPQTFAPAADTPVQNAAAQPQTPAGTFTPQQAPAESFAQPQYAAPEKPANDTAPYTAPEMPAEHMTQYAAPEKPANDTAPYTAPEMPAEHMTQYAAPEMPAETPQAAAFHQETSQTETFAPDMYPNTQTPSAEQTPFTEAADPKAAKKAEKERLKAEKKAERERLKAEKKAAKERAKAEKAAQKAGNTPPAESIPPANATVSDQQPTETVADIYTETASVTAAGTDISGAAVPSETQEQGLPNESAETPAEAPGSAVPGDAASEPDAVAEDTIVFTGSAPSSEISHPDDAAADADASSELDPADAAKKKKLKKSIITFGIVVAAIAVIAVIFFLIFGTSKDPSPVNPSSTDSNTYQDVDELINDLQNN